MRVFIALDLPPELLRAIHQAAAGLRSEIGPAVRWVPADNLHLTLKFLGEIPHSQIDPLTQALRAEAESSSSFEMQIGGLGAFPNPRRPRVIFLGIQAPAELEALTRGVESACSRLGYPPEARGVRPHLTIGRVKPDTVAANTLKISHALESATIDLLGTARVDSVELYKSELKPGGAMYTRVYSARMNKTVP